MTSHNQVFTQAWQPTLAATHSLLHKEVAAAHHIIAGSAPRSASNMGLATSRNAKDSSSCTVLPVRIRAYREPAKLCLTTQHPP